MLIREHLRLEGKARLDGREELTRKLSAEQSATDDELILHAYKTWGDDCITHLIGDFAFVIRDERSQRIFGARDHFGVKPFFYTHIDGEFQFSTRLNELRLEKRVSSELNEIAVGDYLLFGVNQDLSTTIFRDIRRLPPAHTISVTKESVAIKRYWTPENVTEVRFRDPEDYVARFSDLLSLAVRDRLRNTARVGISMSGGLDSTSLAAIACEHTSVHGFAVVYDELIPDEERHYSTVAASHLGISITHVVADPYPLFAGDLDQAEPFLVSPLAGQFNDLLRMCADFSAVAFTGYDGDAFMNEPRPPRLRSRIRRMLSKPDQEMRIPEWIDEAFAARTNLKERLNSSYPSDPVRRSAAFRALNSKVWTPLFEGYDSSATRLDLELRHPFIDVRLVEFLLSLPAQPWCMDKYILRCAMKDKLPPAILNRRKTPLAGDPALQLVTRASVRWLDSFEVSPQLGAFVNLNRRPSIADETNSDRVWASLRVYALNSWLSNSQPAQMEMMMERKPETAVPGEAQEIKKPYHKPEVVVYGNIREITRNAGPKGNSDNGGGAAAGPKTGT